MIDNTDTLLQTRLDAWGRAEVHIASKQIMDPPPAFTNAVSIVSVRRRQTMTTLVIMLLIIAAAFLTTLVIQARTEALILELDRASQALPDPAGPAAAHHRL